MENLKSSTPVQKAVSYYTDKALAGELELFDVTPQEQEDAKARLEARRKRDRKHYENILERMRERDRERCARKKTALKI